MNVCPGVGDWKSYIMEELVTQLNELSEVLSHLRRRL